MFPKSDHLKLKFRMVAKDGTTGAMLAQSRMAKQLIALKGYVLLKQSPFVNNFTRRATVFNGMMGAMPVRYLT